MKTAQFIQLLETNTNKALLFEYLPNQFAKANYHLTEIKKVHFDTVDCGGNPNEWHETQMQLWESPKEIGKTDFMTTDKILSIFKKVDSIKLLRLETELKVEYGNENFHTSVMKIKGFKNTDKQLIIQLFEEKTLCKAPSEPSENKKETACCTPTSGCC